MNAILKAGAAFSLSLLASAACCQDRVIYSFDQSSGGWWTFSNGATVNVSQGKEGANGRPCFLKIDYSYSSAALSWLGAGADSKWVLPPEGWERFSGISIFLKSDKPCPVRIELRCEGKTFSTKLSAVDFEWRKYSIPFSSFEGSPDFKAFKMKQLVIVPEKTDTEPHSLCIDEIALLSAAPALAKGRLFEFSGAVLSDDAKNLEGAKVFLFADDAFVAISSVDVAQSGSYKISSRLPQRPYLAEPEPPAPPAAKLFLTARAEGRICETRQLDSNGGSGVDFKLAPWRSVQTSASLPERPAFIPVSKDLFGVNIGIWSIDAIFADKEFHSAMREAGVGLIRFPGGGRSDDQLWIRDNSKLWFEKPSVQEGHYAGYLTPAHIDKFVELCKASGAKPLFTVNGRSGQPEAAADIVKYANVERKYAIPYWEVGNEPEGWYGWKHDYAFGEMVAKRYSEIYKPYYEGMKAVDPSIKCLAPCSANRDYYDPVLKNFLASFAKTTDIVAIHRYPQDDNDPQHRFDDAKLLKTPEEWGEIIPDIAAWSKAGGGAAKPIVAVTEWNTSFLHPGERTAGLIGGLWTLSNLAEMALNGVDIGAFWCGVDNGNYNMFMRKDGVLVKRPAFHAFKAMSRNFSKGICRGVSGDPLLKVYFGDSGSGRCALLLNNSPDKAFSVKLSAGAPLPKGWNPEAALFDATSRFDPSALASVQEDGSLAAVVPPHSALLAKLPLRN